MVTKVEPVFMLLRTATLAMSETLRDEGFPQNICHFSWGWSRDGISLYRTALTEWGDSVGRIADAPLAEELLEVIRRLGVRMWICHDQGRWVINLVNYVNIHDAVYEHHLVDAAGKAWLLGKRAGILGEGGFIPLKDLVKTPETYTGISRV